MMGHAVLRHRVFYCSYPAEAGLAHSHEGKVVGNRGMRRTLESREQEGNLYGVYSRRYAGRGTYDEWHGALGHELDTFSRKGIAGALPLGYGRLLTAQMVAALLNARTGVPILSPQRATHHQRETLRLWAQEGCPTLPLLKKAPLEKRWTDAHAAQLLRLEPASEPQAPDESPYMITREQQLADPTLNKLLRQLEQQEEVRDGGAVMVKRHEMLYERNAGILGEPKYRLYVPESQRYELMHNFHYTLLGGHRPSTLYSDLCTWYYWRGMKEDCEEFVKHCQHCQERVAAKATKVTPGEVPMPSRPFETIHVDFKVGLPRSGGYTDILVCVDALTRYTIYIPLVNHTAAETFRALLAHVFCVYGIPKKIVADNEFDTKLLREMSSYIGFRKIHVLPYNPKANGLAEAAVKRIKTTLERNTTRLREWHKSLPLAQYLLNCTYHKGIKMKPFIALFGREPVQLPELENPELTQSHGEGSTFLQTLKSRIEMISRQVKGISDNLREVRRLKKAEHQPTNSISVQVGDVVWLLHRDETTAKRLRKSGKGQPWRHRYKVIAVNDFGVKVEPLPGSPKVMEWQPLHKVSTAQPEYYDADYTYELTPEGLELGSGIQREAPEAERRTPFESPESAGPPPDADGTYEIEEIVRATRRGRTWYIEIKWVGWTETTEETKAWLLANATPTVVKEM